MTRAAITLVALLMLPVLVGSGTRASAGSSAPTLLGDVDCSGEIDSRDSLLVLQYHARLIESLSCLDAADMSRDGEIDSFDALLILRNVASFPFVELEIEPVGATVPDRWVDCVYQAAYFADPSLFVESSLFVVIRDQSDLERIWNYAIERGETHPANHCHEIGPIPVLEVDFGHEMVIALIEQYPTGGYSLRLNSLLSRGDSWTVYATRAVPGSGCLVPAVITYRYQVISVPRTELPVSLSVGQSAFDCD